MAIVRCSDFDRQITIQTNTVTNVNGVNTSSWANTYTGVYAKELKALGREGLEGRQEVYSQNRAWLIQIQGMTINTAMRVVYDSENYHIYDVRPYKGSRELYVIEGEKKDND